MWFIGMVARCFEIILAAVGFLYLYNIFVG